MGENRPARHQRRIGLRRGCRRGGRERAGDGADQRRRLSGWLRRPRCRAAVTSPAGPATSGRSRERRRLPAVAARPRVLVDVAETSTATTALGSDISLPSSSPRSPSSGSHTRTASRGWLGRRRPPGRSCACRRSPPRARPRSPRRRPARLAGSSSTASATAGSPMRCSRRPWSRGSRRSCSPSTPRSGTPRARPSERLLGPCRAGAEPGGDRLRPATSVAGCWAGRSHRHLGRPRVARRERAGCPSLLKGVLTAEDARLAVEHGAAAVIVSNHGGRQLDGGLGQHRGVPEVVEAVAERAEVFMDGGVRRGTDVLVALALGARPSWSASAALGVGGRG